MVTYCCKTLVFGEYFNLVLFAIKTKYRQNMRRKYSFVLSYTMSNKWTLIHSMLVSVLC